MGLAITFTTNSYVKHRILHIMRDADAILHVKTGEISVDVLIADVIREFNFRKMNLFFFCTVTYTQIFHAVLYHKYLVLSGPSRGRAGPRSIFRSGPIQNFKLYCVFLKGNKPNMNHRGSMKHFLM